MILLSLRFRYVMVKFLPQYGFILVIILIHRGFVITFPLCYGFVSVYSLFRNTWASVII